jgi:UDP-N-acetylglucosamine 2-epimerase
MNIVTVVGARPQFMKASMLSRELRQRHEEFLVHTGQHYDDLMSDVFFRELGLAQPDVNLGVGSGPHGAQTGRMLEGIEKVLLEHQPDLTIVFGDTNSTLAGALAAAKLGVPVVHVEAGLRSFDPAMPEEINRIVADRISSLLFCPTENAVRLLRNEGREAGVWLTGDLMYDSLLASLPVAKTQTAAVLGARGIEAGAYYLATVHRAANTGDPKTLAALIEAFGRLEAPVIWPVHPRTREALKEAGTALPANLRAVEPVGYLEMLVLEKEARAILTDSGGVPREAYFLAVPCVTLRTETEWPETLVDGWNVLAGCDIDQVVSAAQRPRPGNAPLPAFGDGRAAIKMVEILERDPPYSRS